MSENSPTAGGPSVPNADLVLKRQRLSRAAALLPLALFLPLMLFGMVLRHPPLERSAASGRAELTHRLQRDLQQATGRAAYWRAAARRNGGGAHAALRSRQWGRAVAWQTKHLAAFRP